MAPCASWWWKTKRPWPTPSPAACGGRGWRSTWPPDGGVALEKAATNGYDVVVLDRDLPVVHGDDVCRSLIASSPAPGAAEVPRILMLTASGDLDDRVAGLMLGADDYLGQAVRLRRAGGPDPGARPGGASWR